MEMIKLSIDCVDGTTFYSMGGENNSSMRKCLLKYIEQYDHEGSSLTLEIYKAGSMRDLPVRTINNPEELYSELSK